MTYVCARPDFTVTIKSGFISDWQWAVHAAVQYSADAEARDLRRTEAAARKELIVAISEESRRGRANGAQTVVVLVEGDPKISGFFQELEEDYTASPIARSH
jgi:hypothetical protein